MSRSRGVAGTFVPNCDLGPGGLRQDPWATTTNEAGNYVQTHLMAGLYKVQITASGFVPFETTVEVHVDTSTEVNVSLTIGETQSGGLLASDVRTVSREGARQ